MLRSAVELKKQRISSEKVRKEKYYKLTTFLKTIKVLL